MKILLVVLGAFILSITVAGAQYNRENLTLEATTEMAKYRYKNLQLYPIRANVTFQNYHKGLGNYITLQEALQKKKVIITEFVNRISGDNGSVNTLYIQNVSNDTIMVLSGEVVQGGKQDRVIADDFLLTPKSGKKEIAVFCVEHGRWNAEAGDGRFDKYFNISSNEVRKAASVSKDQQVVWDKVSQTVEKNQAMTSTGTLAALQKSGALNRELTGYTAFFEKLSSASDIIGVVAVSGDQILGCDMFATHAIFEKSYKNLLNSYATEAITSGRQVTISYEKVKRYLQSLLENESSQEEEIKKNGSLLKDGKRKIHISTF